ncbi:hypothetical protein F0562_010618 [Nyssa sinensis]|uniref:Uncharacterized protein n=1 Tax=Nyssa sinensis TaxID=561372 RepID=A0A5J4ZZD5_9ASTE|nr:hypothetical protein F0562_010618 [Nyssa sinensis]
MVVMDVEGSYWWMLRQGRKGIEDAKVAPVLLATSVQALGFVGWFRGFRVENCDSMFGEEESSRTTAAMLQQQQQLLRELKQGESSGGGNSGATEARLCSSRLQFMYTKAISSMTAFLI